MLHTVNLIEKVVENLIIEEFKYLSLRNDKVFSIH